MRARNARGQVNVVQATNEERYGATNRQYETERQDQLNGLYHPMPLTPPERMRATFAFNTFKQPTYEMTYFDGYSAQVQNGYQTLYSVDMVLELSEEERALVIGNDLQTVVLEDKAR